MASSARKGSSEPLGAAALLPDSVEVGGSRCGRIVERAVAPDPDGRRVLTPRSDRERFVNFDWGAQRLTVSVHEDVSGPNEDPLRLMINLDVDDIHAVATRIEANGVTFTRRPEQEPWGGWVATFHDPDGNTVQLLQTPDN